MMPTRWKKLTKLIAVITCFFSSASIIHAADFATTINQNYVLTEVGATVTESININNLSDLRFPTAFSHIIPTANPQNLKVEDAQGKKALYDIEKLDSISKLKITFGEPIVGINKAQQYRLEYQNQNIRLTPNYAQYIIPKNIISESDTTITTTASIPKSICPNPTVFPQTIALSDQASFWSFTYNQNSLHTAVTLLCQKTRNLQTELNYYLENPTMTPVETQITLPPDTNTQQIIFESFDPQPVRIFPDADGNRIATYKLEPKQTIIAKVITKIIIHNPNQTFTTPLNDSDEYLSEQPFWPTHNQSIKQAAKTYDNPEKIYDFITTTAQFNPNFYFQSTQREGGQKLWENPKELTRDDIVDAYITLCRAANIPARKVIGFIDDQQSVLDSNQIFQIHPYAEWYNANTQTWVQVDPAIAIINPTISAKTVSDLSHLALTIQGLHDTIPYPISPSENTNYSAISITDITDIALPPPQLTASINTSLLNLIFPSTTKVIITNQSPFCLHQQDIIISSEGQPSSNFTINRLDLNSQSIIPITYSSSQPININTQYGPITIEHSQKIAKEALTIAALLVTAASLITIIARRILVHRR